MSDRLPGERRDRGALPAATVQRVGLSGGRGAIPHAERLGVYPSAMNASLLVTHF